jgi:hypothetical protein
VESGSGGTEEAPTRILESDSKGSSGHNAVLYWHSVKYEPALNSSGNSTNHADPSSTSRQATRRETEGIAAGSVSGHIRFWTTSQSPTVRSNSKACLWSVLADPHRTTSTASPVVALLAVPRSPAAGSTTHKCHIAEPLLLAATAQGVITVWDLSSLRPASFGSTKPEPKCIRRVDYSAQLLLGGGVALVGVCQARSNPCRFCEEAQLGKARANDASNGESPLVLDRDTLWLQQCVEVVRTAPVFTADSSSSKVGTKATHSAGAGSPSSTEVVYASLLLTLSSGAVYCVELHTDSCRLLQAAPRNPLHPDSAYSVGTASRKYQVNNDPRVGVVVSYEELRREAALTSGPLTATAAARDGKYSSDTHYFQFVATLIAGDKLKPSCICPFSCAQNPHTGVFCPWSCLRGRQRCTTRLLPAAV